MVSPGTAAEAFPPAVIPAKVPGMPMAQFTPVAVEGKKGIHSSVPPFSIESYLNCSKLLAIVNSTFVLTPLSEIGTWVGFFSACLP